VAFVIPSEHRAEITRALAERFDFDAFDAILFQLTGEREILGIASDRTPRDAIAHAVLSLAEERGLAELLFRYVLARRPTDKIFRDLLLTAMPALAAPPAATSLRVDRVVESLVQAQARLRDPEVRRTISASRETIEMLSQCVSTLRIYKELHDCLHQVQMQRLGDLRVAVRDLTSPVQAERLRRFRDQIRAPVADALDALAELPTGDPAHATELRWVTALEKSANGLQEAIDSETSNRALASACLNVMARILSEHPPRLNWLIIQQARAMPLDEAAQTLRRIDEGGGDAVLAEGAARLSELRAALVGRVAIHDQWQKVDEDFWGLDQALLQSPSSALTDFVLDWPRARTGVEALRAADPLAPWAVRCLRYADAVEAHLESIEPLLGGDDSALGSAFSELGRRYGSFSSEARSQFFAIDRALRQDCVQLVRISAPVRALLAELDRG
jgi:hypothetical protein